MEPLSSSVIGITIWEYGVKPIVDSIKKEYGEEVKKLLKTNLNNVWKKLPFHRQELDVIEAEIINIDTETLIDEKKFLEFFEKNKRINDLIIESNSRNKNIDIKVEKGVGYIENMNGDISF